MCAGETEGKPLLNPGICSQDFTNPLVAPTLHQALLLETEALFHPHPGPERSFLPTTAHAPLLAAKKRQLMTNTSALLPARGRR